MELGPIDVSRETLDRLEAYQALLLKWNPRINLVAASTLTDSWRRHFVDSAQLYALAPPGIANWCDIGSGAGFPGLVIAAIASERNGPSVTLVESDHRKCAFLHEAARVMDVRVRVHSDRIEALPGQDADVLSARALAPLDVLLEHTEKHRKRNGTALFPKGSTVHKEVEAARRRWRFDATLHSSATDPGATILEIGAFARV